MKFTVFAGLLAFASVQARSTSHVEGVLVENLHNVPHGWKETGAPAQDRKLHFRIAVRSVSGRSNLIFSVSLTLSAQP